MRVVLGPETVTVWKNASLEAGTVRLFVCDVPTTCHVASTSTGFVLRTRHTRTLAGSSEHMDVSRRREREAGVAVGSGVAVGVGNGFSAIIVCAIAGRSSLQPMGIVFSGNWFRAICSVLAVCPMDCVLSNCVKLEGALQNAITLACIPFSHLLRLILRLLLILTFLYLTVKIAR